MVGFKTSSLILGEENFFFSILTNVPKNVYILIKIVA